jgi:TRAP-type mannitol/chloroaromatic compound transport system permease small subunit
VAARARALNALVRRTTGLLAWVYLLLVAAIIAQVVLRRGFSAGQVALEELHWHLYAIGVMFGAAYAQAADAHVRVDLLHARLSQRGRHLVEALGIVLLALPFVTVVFLHGLDFVADAWRVGERSPAPGGLPYRWAIKSVIPASFALLALSLLARLVEAVAGLLRRGPDGG